MNSRLKGFTLGCLIWILLIGLLASCIIPMAMFFGGFSSTLGAGYVADVLEPYLCPEGSEAEIVTYQLIPRREYYDFEMQCTDASGAVVRSPSPDYAFYWLGVLFLIAVLLSGLLALPLAILLARSAARRLRRSNQTPSF